MPETKPLLTIAIPTYNRAGFLRELMEVLLPQLEHETDVELIVCNNASSDTTAEVVAELLPLGDRYRSLLNAENIGSDANFVRCFREARGKYLWLCGDDDILRPGTVAGVMRELRKAEYDLIYVEPEGFFEDWRKEHRPDPEQRPPQVVRSARAMALTLGTMVAFITATIINRDRALEVMEDQPEAFLGTAIVHLSWMLPLLAHHRQSLCVWDRWVAGRSMNSSFDVAEIFGRRFGTVARRLLHRKPEIARIFINLNLRQWFPLMLLDMRVHQASNDKYGLDKTGPAMRELFRGNPRYWIFVLPVLKLPLPLARAWVKGIGAMNRVINLLLRPEKLVFKVRRRLAGNRRAALPG